ncbi:hypothetical protein SAY87_027359 [Trapa incisa]|uniref:Uncharacterized protein n=1 Tax=Trapa incisa TaxID=236973 RepID=A0AAN7H0R2_9MYRT|nr:hypothetical protein SAY87_027359 [Trapa incisa]
MAEFLPDLDDGELWVPSDIFVNDVVANNCCRNSRLSPRLFLSLDEFSRSFSSTLSQLPPRPYVDYSPLLGFGLSHNYFQVSLLLSPSVCLYARSHFGIMHELVCPIHPPSHRICISRDCVAAI